MKRDEGGGRREHGRFLRARHGRNGDAILLVAAPGQRPYTGTPNGGKGVALFPPPVSLIPSAMIAYDSTPTRPHA